MVTGATSSCGRSPGGNTREGIKQVCDIGTQSWITGKIAQVRVDAACDGIVVARAHAHSVVVHPPRGARPDTFWRAFSIRVPRRPHAPQPVRGPRPGNIMLFVKARLERPGPPLAYGSRVPP